MADREMTSRERLEHVWNFQEPDRVPIEMNISAEAARDPRSAKVRELMAKYSDRFYGWSPNWGWFGMPVKTESKVIEHKPGEYKRVQRIVHSPIGDFDSIDWYPASTIDYAWEKMYFSTPDDLRKLKDVPFYPLKIDPSSYRKRVKQVEDRGLVAVNVPNPFGILVRSAKREDFFSWLILERTLIHDVLSILFAHVTQKLEYLLSIIDAKYFSSSGQELALDPWMSPAMYDEFVKPYDTMIYELIRKHGGNVRIHCHGNAMKYLERFLDSGINGIEPCEPPPQGDVVLKGAKQCVGDRMLLCGNIPSQNFRFTDLDHTEELVKQTIRDGAPGGGFILRTTGGSAGTWMVPELDLDHQLAHCQRLIEAGLKYGKYPINI
jgi:hypothetical protein